FELPAVSQAGDRQGNVHPFGHDIGHDEPGHSGLGVSGSHPAGSPACTPGARTARAAAGGSKQPTNNRIAPDAGITTQAMSKYVKELMMDQLRADLDGSRSLLIVDLKGLDSNAEHQFRRDLRRKSIRLRVLKNSLARRVFSDLGMGGLSQFLEG